MVKNWITLLDFFFSWHCAHFQKRITTESNQTQHPASHPDRLKDWIKAHTTKLKCLHWNVQSHQEHHKLFATLVIFINIAKLVKASNQQQTTDKTNNRLNVFFFFFYSHVVFGTILASDFGLEFCLKVDTNFGGSFCCCYLLYCRHQQITWLHCFFFSL